MLRNFSTVLLAAGAALIATIALASSAAAASIGIEPSRIRGISLGLLTFVDTSGEFESRCSVTLGGTLHRGLINKVANTLLGYITEARQPACSKGQMRLRTESLPWHIRFASIEGTLPERVTGILIRIFTDFSFEAGVTCRYRGLTGWRSLEFRLIGNPPPRYTVSLLKSQETALESEPFCPTLKLVGLFDLNPDLTITRN